MSNSMITGGQVAERIGGNGVKLTAEFINNVLGVKPAGAEKRASLYTEDQFVEICERFQEHLATVQAGNYMEAGERKSRKTTPVQAAADEDDGEL